MNAPLPFADSRRLTGANLFFAGTGVVLEVAGIEPDAGLLAGWQARVARLREALGLGAGPIVARRHGRGASLAFAASPDRLFAATELNEWALCAALAERGAVDRAALEAAWLAEAREQAADPDALLPPVLDETAAVARLKRLLAAEARPALLALIDAAKVRGLAVVLDEDTLSLGSGRRGMSFALDALPAPQTLDWARLGDVPTALVTGSNGKTTTVRLLAACLRAHGLNAGFNCTDGVYVGARQLSRGDYSGPAGARAVLRDAATEAAVLETARGGILRRGIATTRADLVIVTNISADHFGEYGIDDLPALAAVKLSIAGVLAPGAPLVLNADDPLSTAAAQSLPARFGRAVPLALFGQDFDAPALAERRAAGGLTAGVRDGHLLIAAGAAQDSLGEVAALPLTVGGRATYNIANLAAAGLGARLLGVQASAIAGVFAHFGSEPGDNPGRLMRYAHAGAVVLIDYAHNPPGLAGLLAVATALKGNGRLGLLLGHAGNRKDEDIEALARVAAGFRPARIFVKENESQLRGRPPGEIPALLTAALKAAGIEASAIEQQPGEEPAARAALGWARPGDVLVLPLHSLAAREAIAAQLTAAEPPAP